MVKWTEEQEKAICARGCNLLVAAAAGSGKTAVLVERIIQLIIRDKVDIDSLLIATFTHAAAGEMRERISAAILAELEKKNENEEHLRRQLNMLSRANISTLHSFCIEVVRRHFHLIDVDPNFRIGDTTETQLMKQEILEELFEAEYEKADERFLGLVEMYGGGKDDSPLKELLLSCYEFIQSKPSPKEWLAERAEDFAVTAEDFEDSPWVKTVLEQIGVELVGARECFCGALKIARKPSGPRSYEDVLLADLCIVDELAAAAKQGIFALYRQLAQVDFKKLPRASKDVDEHLKEEAQQLRDEGKEIIKEIQTKVLAQSPEEFVRELNELYPFMRYLCSLINTFDERYREKKLEKGIVDFSDMEHYALEILSHEEIAEEYRQKFAYIFVDEYQDSNLVQETILNRIKREDNLFMVGDVKQSIYRFRLADPSLFIEKYELYQNREGTKNFRIDLRKNFRSRGEIIDGVNYLFRQIMSKAFGEIDYDENACLYQGAQCREFEDPSVEVCIVEKGKGIEGIPEEIEEMEDLEVEARMVARRIRELTGQQIYDQRLDAYRKIDYRDIVVLLRTTANTAQVFMEVFAAEGIPAYADVNAGYFEAIEVNILLNLLRIIDNKRQDIPLLSVMRSPFCRFEVEDLIRIRVSSEAPTYFEAIEEYLQTGEDGPLKEKLQEFVGKLDAWKEEARFVPLDEFIYKLLMETGYYYYVGAMPKGVQRQANLWILLDRARQFQKTSVKGLFNFIKFVDKLKANSADFGTARILGENDNVVRIMSIHKSKGLEFPVVIVAGLGKNFNLRDTNASVLFHKDLGIGPKYVNPTLRVYTDTIAKLAMKSKIRLESLAEEMRILYVACTRPKDKLILVGSVRNLSSAAKKWARAVNPYNLSKGKNFMDWLGPALLRHPDGGPLRELAQAFFAQDKLIEDQSRWKIKIVDRSQLEPDAVTSVQQRVKLRKMLEEFKPQAGSAEREAVLKRLNWEYGYMDAVNIPSKLSVTQVKQSKAAGLESVKVNIPPLVARPKFMEGKRGFTPAERGTLTHFVLQRLKLDRVDTLESIREQIRAMVDNELLRSEEADAVETEKIFAFFQSGLGRRVLRSDRVCREVPFNLLCRACEVIEGAEKCDDGMLIQGVIDLYFWEGDELVLVDYKTDRITPANRESVIRKYTGQLELYRTALERIKGKSVKESYLYLLDSGEEVRL